MAPAQRLVENELAEQFGVTRASARAALIELESEGLVERIRNRGSQVRVVTVEEAVAITECRMVLEGPCSAKAAVSASDEQLTELVDLGTAMSEAVADGEPMTYSDLNHELHARIREFSGQAVAVELLERLNAQLVRHRFQLALRPGRPRQERAAATLGAEVRFYDAGDHPLVATAELTDRLVDVYRATQPDVVLTRPTEDPYNGDHPAANRMALEAHVLTQAIGYPGPGEAGRPERPPPCRAVPAQDSGEARGAAGYPMDTPAAAPEGWRMHAASGRPVAETALRPHRAARRPPA